VTSRGGVGQRVSHGERGGTCRASGPNFSRDKWQERMAATAASRRRLLESAKRFNDCHDARGWAAGRAAILRLHREGVLRLLQDRRSPSRSLRPTTISARRCAARGRDWPARPEATLVPTRRLNVDALAAGSSPRRERGPKRWLAGDVPRSGMTCSERMLRVIQHAIRCGRRRPGNRLRSTRQTRAGMRHREDALAAKHGAGASRKLLHFLDERTLQPSCFSWNLPLGPMNRIGLQLTS